MKDSATSLGDAVRVGLGRVWWLILIRGVLGVWNVLAGIGMLVFALRLRGLGNRARDSSAQ